MNLPQQGVPRRPILPKPGKLHKDKNGNICFNRNVKMEKAKVSAKPPGNPNQQLISYGANTHNGIIRNYNEDRISIVLDLKKPNG